MPRRKTHLSWIGKQKLDGYYRRAKKEGFRARSAYKLSQIDAKYQVFTVNGKFARNILDLGCAPGAWIEVIIEKYKAIESNYRPKHFKILGIDLNSIRSFGDDDIYVDFFRGDIFKEETEIKIQQMQPFSIILSDLAPKTTGDDRDVAIQESMVEKVFDFITKYLQEHGNVVIKLFQSEQTQYILNSKKNLFSILKLMKPKASRDSSREIYLIGLNFNKINAIRENEIEKKASI